MTFKTCSSRRNYWNNLVGIIGILESNNKLATLEVGIVGIAGKLLRFDHVAQADAVRDHGLNPRSKQEHLGHKDLALKAYAIHRILPRLSSQVWVWHAGKESVETAL